MPVGYSNSDPYGPTDQFSKRFYTITAQAHRSVGGASELLGPSNKGKVKGGGARKKKKIGLDGLCPRIGQSPSRP